MLFLFRVGDEAHFDQHRRHVGADEHPERRLLKSTDAHGHTLPEGPLDKTGKLRGLVDVTRLCHLPADHLDVADATPEHRNRHAGLCRPLCLLTIIRQAEIEDLRARGCRPCRRVCVKAEEEIGLVVVGDSRPLVKAHGLIPVASEDHPCAKT